MAMCLVMMIAMGVSARADTIIVGGQPIEGHILEVWRAAGGQRMLGVPDGTRTLVAIPGSRRVGQHQHFWTDEGWPAWVIWTYRTGQAGIAPKIPRLAEVRNERDALFRSGFRFGVVYRSGKLCDATVSDRLIMAGLLQDPADHTIPSTGGLIIDFRSRGKARECPDPRLSQVGRLHLPIPGDAIYTRYVTSASRRAAFGAALSAVVAEPGPVWVHCTAGKDRTGWFVAMLLYALGASDETVLLEFRRTRGAPVGEFQAALGLARSIYGSIDAYLETGLGVTPELRVQLLAKLRLS